MLSDTHERTVDLEICDYCAAMLANGECGDCHNERGHPCPTGVRLSRRWSGDEHLFVGDEVTDFSMSPCDGCGSDLGGTRYAAVGWVPRAVVVARVERWHGTRRVVVTARSNGAVAVVVRQRGTATLRRTVWARCGGGAVPARYQAAAVALRQALGAV